MLSLMVNDVNLDCINAVAYQYHVPAKLIIAVLNTEQSRRGLIHHNKNGTVDLGEMQINSGWWPALYRYHITPAQVLYQPCINLEAGVWILATSIGSGKNLLQGIGNYHSHTPIYNYTYTEKIREKYTALQLGLET